VKAIYLLIGMAFIAPLESKAGERITVEAYCDKTTTVVKALREQHQEVPVLFGNASDRANSIMSLWVNVSTDTWTILTTKDDTSCVIGVGENIKSLPIAPSTSI
jgi:hypothetical protein